MPLCHLNICLLDIIYLHIVTNTQSSVQMSRRMSRMLPSLQQRVATSSSSSGLHTSAVAGKDKLDMTFNDHELVEHPVQLQCDCDTPCI